MRRIPRNRSSSRRLATRLKRQVVLAGVALVAVIVGFGLGILSRPEPAVEVPVPAVAEAPAPVLPEPNGRSPAAPLLAYEEALPDDIYLPESSAAAPVGPAAPPHGWSAAPEPPPIHAWDYQGPLPRAVNLLPMPPPSADPERLPAWVRHAARAAPAGNGPAIAIVIDDLGLDRRRTAATIALSAPLTLAFLPYADALPQQAAAARAAGHELLVHMGMQPMSDAVDPGPNVLRADLPADELRRRIAWGLSRFDGYVGVNNHMGSRFTTDPGAMAVVLGEIKERGLLFLDSRTSGRSVAGDVARDLIVPNATRNVFLDNVNDVAAVRARLDEVERIARRRGYAIAIGHPRDATLAALQDWIATAEERGFALVPLSRIVARAYAGDAAAAFLESRWRPRERAEDADTEDAQDNATAGVLPPPSTDPRPTESSAVGGIDRPYPAEAAAVDSPRSR